jgi:hypothetical protein
MGMGISIEYHFLSPWVPSRATFAGYKYPPLKIGMEKEDNNVIFALLLGL